MPEPRDVPGVSLWIILHDISKFFVVSPLFHLSCCLGHLIQLLQQNIPVSHVLVMGRDVWYILVHKLTAGFSPNFFHAQEGMHHNLQDVLHLCAVLHGDVDDCDVTQPHHQSGQFIIMLITVIQLGQLW
ncbi:hypothetical protein ANANG_G00147250 [Anguilla anguilla]|uniref:Uncharacterized protein n=1 Tax=Anguilla anguilla TaxID=7936 RepID=A0A9D3MBY6_ANGAN|nr:hypothetical protein ANANG_G00147250 [Anguilla anguilla]